MAISNRQDAVLIVGDEGAMRKPIATKLLADGYPCLVAAGGTQAMELIAHQDISLALLDMNLPGRLAFRLLQEIKSESPNTVIIMVTDVRDIDVAIQCIRLGAYDYITKPFHLEGVTLCIQRALEKRRLELANCDFQQTLELRVAERTRDLSQALAKIKSASVDTIIRLSRAAEYKDEDTGSHIQRMSRYTALIAERMGLADSYVESILYGAAMHDIGKIGIPDSILLKPGKLDDREWSIMKQHTIIGARILDGSESDIMKLGAVIAISHHEKWDGTGYPFGLKGEDIPLSGRIAAIADVFDSLTSKRVYRKDDFSPVETFKVIEQSIGRQFDPGVFAAFKAGWPDILAEQERFRRIDISRREETAHQQAIEVTA